MTASAATGVGGEQQQQQQPPLDLEVRPLSAIRERHHLYPPQSVDPRAAGGIAAGITGAGITAVGSVGDGAQEEGVNQADQIPRVDEPVAASGVPGDEESALFGEGKQNEPDSGWDADSEGSAAAPSATTPGGGGGGGGDGI
ncbi:unnamed protein product, partial [Ectocarpus fasciculatus]